MCLRRLCLRSRASPLFGQYHGGPACFTELDGERLMQKKLQGLLNATAGAAAEHRWDVNLLHVWCEADSVADTLHRCVAHGRVRACVCVTSTFDSYVCV